MKIGEICIQLSKQFVCELLSCASFISTLYLNTCLIEYYFILQRYNALTCIKLLEPVTTWAQILRSNSFEVLNNTAIIELRINSSLI